MSYGIVKLDRIVYTSGGLDANILVSGFVSAVSGVVSGLFPSGTAAAPSVTVGTSSNGLYSPGTDQVAISTSGTERFRFDSTGQLESVSLGTAAAPVFSFTTDPNTGIYSPGADQLAISTGGSGRLFIDSSGRVGVGVSSPQSLFHVDGDATAIRVTRGSAIGFAYNTGTAATDPFRIQSNGGAVDLLSAASQPITLSAGGSEKVRVTSAGLVGIGTTGPTQLLHLAANNGNLYFQPVSNAEARIQAEGGTGGVATALTFHTYNGASNGERARLTGSGQLLVGTSDGSGGVSKLVVQGASNGSAVGVAQISYNGLASAGLGAGTDIGYLRFTDQGSNSGVFAQITATADATSGANDYPGRLVFSTTADGASSPTERMRINNNGTHAMYGLDDILYSSTNRGAGTTYATYVGRYGATSTTTGTISFLVFSNGNVQNTNNSYGAYSDVKLKENIVDAGSQWDDLKALQVRKYNFKEGQTHTQIGLVAQEVELVSPGLVTESPDRDAEGNDLGTVTKSVNYSVLYMKAVKALQEAMERIETLEAKVAALKAP